MTDFLLIQTSSNSRDGAQRIADALIQQRLAAACWVYGPIDSTFWWEGKIGREQEWVCSLKARREFYSKVEQAIKEVHTYEIPEIVAVPIIEGSQSFLTWVTQETKAE